MLPLESTSEEQGLFWSHAKSLSFLNCPYEIFSYHFYPKTIKNIFDGIQLFSISQNLKAILERCCILCSGAVSYWACFVVILLWRPSNEHCWLDFWLAVMILEGGNKLVLYLPFPRFQPSGEAFQAIAQVYLNDPPRERQCLILQGANCRQECRKGCLWQNQRYFWGSLLGCHYGVLSVVSSPKATPL